MSNNSFIYVPRWPEVINDQSRLVDVVAYLEERDRKLEDFLSFLSQDDVRGDTLFASPDPAKYFYFATRVSFLYTLEASYNYVSYNAASSTYSGSNFYAEDTAHPRIALYNTTSTTASVLHHDGTNNQLDVFAKDMSTYRPIKASAFTVSSSRTTKSLVRPFTDEMPRLSPVRFCREGKEHVGLIAEEVAETFPEASDGSGIDYAQIVAALVAQVQRLEARIIDLETGSVVGESDRAEG